MGVMLMRVGSPPDEVDRLARRRQDIADLSDGSGVVAYCDY